VGGQHRGGGGEKNDKGSAKKDKENENFFQILRVDLSKIFSGMGRKRRLRQRRAAALFTASGFIYGRRTKGKGSGSRVHRGKKRLVGGELRTRVRSRVCGWETKSRWKGLRVGKDNFPCSIEHKGGGGGVGTLAEPCKSGWR